MSMQHNFSDDPNSFHGPPAKSSNTPAIVVAIAIVCGTLMLICGGVIFGIVMTVREQINVMEQQFDMQPADQQWEGYNNPTAFQEYSDFVASGRYADAIESADRGLESDPDNSFLHNNKAWLLATCPDDGVRNGTLAVEHATRACELTAWNNAFYVDTLAAANAEAGDFASAVKWQEEAIRLGGGAFAGDFQQRLRLFKAGKAFREGVPPFQATSDEPMEVESPFDVDGGDDAAIESNETNTPDENPQP